MKKQVITALCGLCLSAALAMPAGAQVYVHIGPPVAPREVIPVAPQPGYLWHPGYHRWDGAQYVWVPGEYVAPPRPGVAWVPGHWRHTHHGYIWIEGHYV